MEESSGEFTAVRACAPVCIELFDEGGGEGCCGRGRGRWMNKGCLGVLKCAVQCSG